MMTLGVAFVSAFRDCAGVQISRYLAQVKAFQDLTRGLYDVHVVAGEGDSKDRTRAQLAHDCRRLDIALTLVDASHGGPRYGSTEEPARMTALSGVANTMLDNIATDVDFVVYVESDLIWGALTVLKLMERLPEGWDVVAPLVFAGDMFYDVWAFRMDGKDGAGVTRFSPFPPFHSGFALTGVTEVDSVGSCLVMRGDVARTVRIRDNNALVGWCTDARRQGFRLGVDADRKVFHP